MKKEIEFNNIISDIIKNEKFIALKNEDHHGISRMEHSLNVAKIAFHVAKRLKLKNINSITRAALLHDLFTNDEMPEGNNLVNHPKIAAENAKKIFNINSKEYNAIEAHMFPLGKKMPKHTESWMVTIADKSVAVYECCRYKLPLKAGVLTIFITSVMSTILFTK